MASDDPVLVKQHDRISVIRLNRPAAMNAVGRALRAILTESLPRLDASAMQLTRSSRRWPIGSIARDVRCGAWSRQTPCRRARSESQHVVGEFIAWRADQYPLRRRQSVALV